MPRYHIQDVYNRDPMLKMSVQATHQIPSQAQKGPSKMFEPPEHAMSDGNLIHLMVMGLVGFTLQSSTNPLVLFFNAL